MNLKFESWTEDSWSELVRTLHGVNGASSLRQLPEAEFEVFFGVQSAGLRRFFSLAVKGDLRESIRVTSTKVLEASIDFDEVNHRTTVQLLLIEPKAHQVFTPFCNDLVSSLEAAESEAAAVKIFQNRYDDWRYMLSKASAQGLSDEEQLGLFGELCFLRDIVFPRLGHGALTSWLGPDRSQKDFVFNKIGVEVKATRSVSAPSVSISSARQLSSDGFQNLALWVLRVSRDVADQGQNLIEMTDALLDSMDMATADLFRAKLASYGFIRAVELDNNQRRFFALSSTVYEVSDDFPRLDELTLPNGVAEVSYKIALSALNSWGRDAEWLNGLLG